MKTANSNNVKQKAAYYQAGAICAYFVFGLEVEKATIDFTNELESADESKKRKSIDLSRPETVRAFIEQKLLFEIAGAAAETKHAWSKKQWSDLENVINHITPIALTMDIKKIRKQYDRTWLQTEGNDLLETSGNFNRYLYYMSNMAFEGKEELSLELTKAFRHFIVLRSIQLFDNKTVWRLVEDLASELLKKGTLSGDEIEPIIDQHEFHQNPFVREFADFHLKSLRMFRKDEEPDDEASN